MARKTKEEAEKTRLLILDTALKVFHEKGYSGSTLVDIAKGIDLTKGAIYWHFKSKVDLFLELGIAMQEKIEVDMADIFIHPGSIANLKNIASHMLEVIGNDPQLNMYYSLVYYGLEWQDDLLPVKNYFFKQDKEFTEYIVSLFKQVQESGELNSDLSARSMAAGYQAISDGFLSRILLNSSDLEDIIADLNFALDAYFTGLQK